MADAETLVYIILDVVIALLVITGNVLVCCVIVNSRALRKKAMYIFVISLALADLFVGMTAIPFGILTRLGIPYNNPVLCMVILSFIMISTQISIFNMTAISVERYFAIRHPRIHFTKLSPQTSIYIIVVTWFLAVVIGLLPLLGWNRIRHLNKNCSIPSSIQNISNKTSHIYTTTSTYVQPTSIKFDSSSTEDANNNLSKTICTTCRFGEIMDDNYMFFNFTVCVLPPLFICAVSYFAIFLSLKQTRHSITEEKNYLKANRSDIFNFKSSAEQIYEKLYGGNKENRPGAAVIFELDDRSSKERNLTKAEPNGNGQFSSYVKDSLDAQHISCNSLSQERNYETSSLKNILKDKKTIFFKKKKENPSVEAMNFNQTSSFRKRRNISESSYPHFDSPSLYRRNSRQIRVRKEIKAAGVLGVIVLAFVICWLPIHILNTIKRFNKYSYIHQLWLFDVAILLTHANSALNFFLYSWRLKAFRKQLHRLLTRKFSCLFSKT